MTSLLHYSKKCGKVNIYHGKGERMRKWLKRLFCRYFDYRITGHYFTHDKYGYLVKKYNRQYYLRKR